ncbi:MAG TPA: hypothetical protein VK171_09210 [Fimbriimonas sp.]|nr:hypothetical protein [Fimbriimonas sp.]
MKLLLFLVLALAGVSYAAEPKSVDFDSTKYRWLQEDQTHLTSLAFCTRGKATLFVYNLDGNYGTPLSHAILYQAPADRWPYPLDGPLAITRMIRTELGDEMPSRFLKTNLPEVLRDSQSTNILGAAILSRDLFKRMWSSYLAPEVFEGESELLLKLVRDVELAESGNRWILKFTVQCRGSTDGIALTRMTAIGIRRPFSVKAISSRIVVDDQYWENRDEKKLREALASVDDEAQQQP